MGNRRKLVRMYPFVVQLGVIDDESAHIATPTSLPARICAIQEFQTCQIVSQGLYSGDTDENKPGSPRSSLKARSPLSPLAQAGYCQWAIT